MRAKAETRSAGKLTARGVGTDKGAGVGGRLAKLAAAAAFWAGAILSAPTAFAGGPADHGSAKGGAVLLALLDAAATLGAAPVDDAALAAERGKADIPALPSVPSSQQARVILWDEVRKGTTSVSSSSGGGSLQTNTIVRVR